MKIKRLLLSLLTLTATGVGAENVACVGNSITYGYGLPWGTSYPTNLQELLGSDYSVGNYGVSGSTFSKRAGEAYWNTSAFNTAYNSAPGTVVIELGTNDSKFFLANDAATGTYNYNYGFVGVDELKVDYASLIDTFAHLDSKPEIWATLQPYSNNVSWTITDTAITNTINPLIKEVAIEKGVNIIDLHTLFRTPAWYLDDSVHPNETGAKELARIIFEHLTTEQAHVSRQGNRLTVEAPYGCYWYKDGKVLADEQDNTLNITEKGTYKALIKLNEETASYRISEELTVDELTEGDDKTTTGETVTATTPTLSYGNHQLRITVPSYKGICTVRIYDMQGHLVALLHSEANATIGIELEKGIYGITLEAGDYTQKKTVIAE